MPFSIRQNFADEMLHVINRKPIPSGRLSLQSVCPCFHLSVCLSVRPSVCLSLRPSFSQPVNWVNKGGIKYIYIEDISKTPSSACLYNKKNITRRLEDMNFIFEWQNNILRTSGGVLMIFRRFPTTFLRFSKIVPKARRTFPNTFREFPKMSEDFPRLPKTFEEDPKMFR